MSDFADVERFARDHAGCGGFTPAAMPRPSGGYLLTIACACGASFDRWVSPEDARRPLPIPAGAARAPAPTPPPSPPPQPASPPTLAPPPSRRSPPPSRPVPPVLGAAAAPAKPRPRPSADLEQAMREALAAENPGGPSPPPAPPLPPPRPPVARPAPPRVDVDATSRASLAQPAEVTLPRPRRASRRWAVWLALFVSVGLGAAGAVYVLGGPGAFDALLSSGPVAPAPGDPQRAALEAAVTSLRELHVVAASTTSVSVYAARVESAKTTAERFLAVGTPGPDFTRVREALDMHLLAVSAWRAKSLDQKEAWEAVGLHPAVELCPPLRLVADFALQPESVSRGQARGVAVASALPLLWECANERIAALEQALAGR